MLRPGLFGSCDLGLVPARVVDHPGDPLAYPDDTTGSTTSFLKATSPIQLSLGTDFGDPTITTRLPSHDISSSLSSLAIVSPEPTGRAHDKFQKFQQRSEDAGNVTDGMSFQGSSIIPSVPPTTNRSINMPHTPPATASTSTPTSSTTPSLPMEALVILQEASAGLHKVLIDRDAADTDEPVLMAVNGMRACLDTHIFPNEALMRDRETAGASLRTFVWPIYSQVLTMQLR
jgi:hypothetical protein